MIDSAYYFQNPASLPGIFDELFGGLFLVKGIPLVGQLLILIFFSLATAATARSVLLPGRSSRIFDYAFSAILLVGISVFLLQPWDEVFINLRHCVHLAAGDGFSFNRHEALEGTVDFLPYFIVGLVAKFGFSPIELAFLQSLFGAFACVVAASYLVRRMDRPRAVGVTVLALCVFPPLAFNASHGFSTTWLSAAALGAIGSLFFERGRRTQVSGIALLAVLSLIRIEGLLLGFGLGFFWATKFQSRKERTMAALGVTVACLIPFAALTAYRIKTFGHAIPTPVQFKASAGNLFYGAIGVRNLAADLISCGVFGMLGVFASLYFLGRRRNIEIPRKITEGAKILGVLALFCLPYYLSGGDWFPSYWGRYLLPFTLFTVTLTIATLDCLFSKLNLADRQMLIVGNAIAIGLQIAWPMSAVAKQYELVFFHRRTLAKIHEPTIGRGHYRVQHLSQLGNHLRMNTDERDRIGSSEIATIMYFADRETIDYLGVVNPKIASSPLRNPPSLFRHFPGRSELPYLIFKRLRPDLLEETRPEILYTFDFMLRDQMPELPMEELTESRLFVALDRWERKLGPLMEPLYGGLGNILKLGYKPVIVRYGSDFISMYFVSKDAIERHLATLRRNGFIGGEIRASAN